MTQKSDKRHEFLPYTSGATSLTPELNGKKFPWGKQGAFHVKDGGEARALQEKYDGMVVSMPVKSPGVHDRGHRYFFGGWPEMPWKRKEKQE